ncbi:MAG: CHAP domain-containing protein [Bacteroidales bacterium]|nr:CHAP domain-containing protein [Bacteroidales bacterium]
MRKYIVYRTILFLIFSFSVTQAIAQENIPELNKRIIEYVESVIDKQVDRGECWDLAYQALNRFNAQWDGKFQYGKLINPKREPVLPGDIIQFKNVKIKYQITNTTYTEFMKQHTAIVYKVKHKNVFTIAHQNTEFSGRKVGLSDLNLNDVVKGDVKIYRPILKSNK